ncbi:MAG: hypothetical protein ACXWT3_02165 [Methylococcaceae bacterium]
MSKIQYHIQACDMAKLTKAYYFEGFAQPSLAEQNGKGKDFPFLAKPDA